MSASYLLAGGGLIRLFSDTGVIAKGSPMLMALTISGQAYDVLPLCTSALEACWGFRRQHRPLLLLRWSRNVCLAKKGRPNTRGKHKTRQAGS